MAARRASAAGVRIGRAIRGKITPRAMMEAMSSPDKVAARRAMEAMYQMKKIDIAMIRKAFVGEAA
jgi:2-polyprenyl-6-hydroxyphenyl methylase/3-demethylubiquinone-9 3-methyltransferase